MRPSVLAPVRPLLVALSSAMLVSAPVAAQERPIDVERSTITIFVDKGGLFSAFADNHLIRAPIEQGRLTGTNQLSVDLAIKSTRLAVVDPSLAPDKRAEVQRRMLGPEVLDVSRYPDIRFVSTRILPKTDDTWEVTGDLTLHGVSRRVTTLVTRRGDRYRGEARIRQRDFGIEPIRVAAGTVTVKDELRIEFEIVAGS
ncbi:MAG: YceI family protein [Acidobacteria bacterium]|nr:YceI family protein [Acidobacteriota bacterium]